MTVLTAVLLSLFTWFLVLHIVSGDACFNSSESVSRCLCYSAPPRLPPQPKFCRTSSKPVFTSSTSSASSPHSVTSRSDISTSHIATSTERTVTYHPKTTNKSPGTSSKPVFTSSTSSASSPHSVTSRSDIPTSHVATSTERTVTYHPKTTNKSPGTSSEHAEPVLTSSTSSASSPHAVTSRSNIPTSHIATSTEKTVTYHPTKSPGTTSDPVFTSSTSPASSPHSVTSRSNIPTSHIATSTERTGPSSLPLPCLELCRALAIGFGVFSLFLLTFGVVITLLYIKLRFAFSKIKEQQQESPYMDLMPSSTPAAVYNTLGTGSVPKVGDELYENQSVVAQHQQMNRIPTIGDDPEYEFVF